MMAVWHVKLDIESNKKKERLLGVVVTQGAIFPPDVKSLLGPNQTLLAIQSVSLLVEYNQPTCDFTALQV